MTVADDSTEEHGHHLPAVEDWPRGFGEASWWPFVTALGGAGIYVGAALFLLAQGQQPIVDPIFGPVVFIGSVGLFLAGLYGWVYHAFVKAFWSSDGHGDSALRWGMTLFLGSEIATFSAGFVYYFFIRVGTWSTEGLPHLLGSLVLINTALLILSSFTLHWGHVELRKGNRKNFLVGLAATLLLGVVFIGGQVLEYYEFIQHEGFTLTSGIFASAFYGLTGLHGLHVSMGAVLIGIVFVRALYGQYSADRHVSVTTVSMYWHFVDAVWIFLVVVLYAGAEITV
ncbi:heme-copper oxidase subunit III [Halorussus sp. MSC15.2]|uniref:cytochrome c oxidase subunit 3 n=1 Tax=Halorussus sp. MSC15.2 TaxID=2283638 RepID=UPI0013D60739|nr:heme-copper oxidase subunit III [Halorussus sp. MSC15.2]NEU56617.1 heme-copper oxidase subunit III [Halorussus sp. MSC15.2]